MKKLIAAFVLLVGWVQVRGQDRPEWVACQAYANLANTRDRSRLDKLYQPLHKSFIVRAIYAERLYAFHADQRDTSLLDSLPKNGNELQAFYNSVDCDRDLKKKVTHMDALAASFEAYFIDASRAVVRHPEYMRQFVRMYTQFNSTPVDNVDLDEQICTTGVYVYLHRKTELLAAMPSAKDMPHTYNGCP